MAIVETLIASIGISVGKALFEGWLKEEIPDGSLESATLAVSSGFIDLIKKKANDGLTAREAKAQFDQVAIAVAKNLSPIVESNRNLNEASKEAVIKAVGDAIRGYNARDLFTSKLSPNELSQLFLENKSNVTVGLSEAEVSLFDRLLKEASALLVKMGSKLPGFEIEAFKTLIASENELLRLVREVLDELRQIAQGEKSSNQKFAEFEIDYRNEVTWNLNRMDHLGLGSIGNEIQEAPLDVAYVSIRAQGKRHKHDPEEAQEALFGFEREGLGIEEILSSTKYLLIRGAAGCGKTTLLRWLAVQIAGRKLKDDVLKSWQDKIPFYIRLRDFSERDLPNPEDFLDFAAQNIKGKMPEGWVHQHLKKDGRGVILIDGVDELPEERRPEVKTKIRSWQKSFPNIPIVVTSRPSDEVKENWLDE